MSSGIADSTVQVVVMLWAVEVRLKKCRNVLLVVEGRLILVSALSMYLPRCEPV